MLEGVVARIHGGFAFVQAGEISYRCTARGRLKHERVTVLVGDRVEFSPLGASTAVLEKVLPRRTEFLRPPVANIDQVLLVQAVSQPPPALLLLDRLIIQAGRSGVGVLIVWNKADLDARKACDLAEIYQKAGFNVAVTSIKTGAGLQDLKKALKNHITVLAGPSGTGKTSLLGAILPELKLKTGEVSLKIQRGRHTTRLVELLSLGGEGLVLDTPGFSSLHLPPLKKTELKQFYPEFLSLTEKCYYRGCLHDSEPLCAVRAALEAGIVDGGRYARYLQLLRELESKGTLK